MVGVRERVVVDLGGHNLQSPVAVATDATRPLAAASSIMATSKRMNSDWVAKLLPRLWTFKDVLIVAKRQSSLLSAAFKLEEHGAHVLFTMLQFLACLSNLPARRMAASECQ